MNPEARAVSPEELRQQIAERLAKAFEQSTGSTWLYDKGADMADVILALPAIRRALARDAAIEAAHATGHTGEYFLIEWEVAGWCRDHADPLMRALKAVGVTTDANGRPYPTCEGSYQCAATTHILGCFMSRPETASTE